MPVISVLTLVLSVRCDLSFSLVECLVIGVGRSLDVDNLHCLPQALLLDPERADVQVSDATHSSPVENAPRSKACTRMRVLRLMPRSAAKDIMPRASLAARAVASSSLSALLCATMCLRLQGVGIKQCGATGDASP